ncbi:MAG: sulfite exporter TauE/SafE family protein [Lentisphaeria bacterium]
MGSDLYSLTTYGWFVAIACAGMVGMSKAGLPGLGAVAVPLMAMVFPPKLSTGILLPILIAGDVIGVSYFHRHADWKVLIRIIPMALVGIVIGFFIMRLKCVDDNFIRISIGVLILVLLGFKEILSHLKHDYLANLTPVQGVVVACFFGVLAGVTTLMANAAGPIMLIYMLVLALPKNVLIGTSAWYFMVLNLTKFPFMIKLGLISKESLLFNAKLVPFVIVGCVIGIVISKKMSSKSFEKWIVFLTVIAALKLLWN